MFNELKFVESVQDFSHHFKHAFKYNAPTTTIYYVV